MGGEIVLSGLTGEVKGTTMGGHVSVDDPLEIESASYNGNPSSRRENNIATKKSGTYTLSNESVGAEAIL